LTAIGCQDWPDESQAAVQAAGILSDLSKIQTVPDPNIRIPDIYKAPPKKVKQIINGTEEWRLFYFCRYHISDKIKQIINEQFSTNVPDQKGQPTTRPDYTVTSNPDTNQLIVSCPTEKDIDAVFEVLQETDIPPIQVRIDCLISEIYADFTMDRETSIYIEKLFGENIFLGGKETSAGELLPAFPGAALRDSGRSKFGLKIGYSKLTGSEFKTLVDILVSRGYLKILMNPTLEVINGQSAKIQTKEHVPLQTVTTYMPTQGEYLPETRIEYVDVIDSLEVTPHVFADGYIGLQTTARISSKMSPEGIKQTPIVTEREITNKDNRIRHGESLIIGGIRKVEKRDVIRGVPGLKDIPVLNLFFSSRDFEERAKEVIFIITPTISTGGKPNQEMIDMLKEMHASPVSLTLHESLSDPFGIKAREMEQQRKVDQAQEAMRQSEMDKTMSRFEAMTATENLESMNAELQQTKAKLQDATARAKQAQDEAQQAKAAQKAAEESQKTKENTEKPKEESAKQKPKSDQPPGQSKKDDSGKGAGQGQG
jgi:hypothetical protein